MATEVWRAGGVMATVSASPCKSPYFPRIGSPVNNRIIRTALVAVLGVLPITAAITGHNGSPSQSETVIETLVGDGPSADQDTKKDKKDKKNKKNKKQGKKPGKKQGKSKQAGLKPRAGLSRQQMDHARTIVETGQEMGLPRRAYVVAIATAMQESRISVLANTNVPRSFKYKPRDGYGSDHDSVGIFQQRVRFYCVNDLQYCMDPRFSAMKFYNGLKRVNNWEKLPVTVAAQRVQGSAFPGAYAKHTGAAKKVVQGVLQWQRR